jgi:hypothetical protein
MPSSSVTAKQAPPVSSIFHLAPADPGHAAASLGHPAPTSLYLEMPSQGVNSSALIPRVNPILNHPPTFNGVNALTLPVIGHYPLSGAPLAPI